VTPLRLFVLGATGGTGRTVVEQAVARGHRVTAFVRSPDKLAGLTGPRVTRGDPRNADEVRAAIGGHDAVISTLGPSGLGRTTLVADCARATVDAMTGLPAGPDRLVIVGVGALFRQGPLTALMRATFLRHIAADAANMERVVVASTLSWTIVRAPRLTHAPPTGHYRSEPDRMPRAAWSPATASLGRADLASCLLDEAERATHVRRIIGVSR
jgi:putative NADH-flavin reductase